MRITFLSCSRRSFSDSSPTVTRTFPSVGWSAGKDSDIPTIAALQFRLDLSSSRFRLLEVELAITPAHSAESFVHLRGTAAAHENVQPVPRRNHKIRWHCQEGQIDSKLCRLRPPSKRFHAGVVTLV